MRLGRLLCVFLVSVPLLLVPAARASAGEPRLILHVIDCADLRPNTMTEIQHNVIRILMTAAILPSWVEGPPKTPLSPGAHVTVVLLSREMTERKVAAEHIGPNVLGTALPGARRGWVFVDRVEELAWQRGESIPLHLAGAIAHETAHALGGIKHSSEGVMAESLGRSEQIYLGFGKTERDQLHAALVAERETPPAAEQIALTAAGRKGRRESR